MLKIVKGVCAAAPLVIISLAWIPPQASAQLLPCIPGLTCASPDNTPPTVRITSPASGATVSGTITVTADASDNVGVAGVQFKYNGINFDAEDNFPPYTATAYTNNIPDGSYTLTAVARDAAGNQTTSAPVTITISNAPPPPEAVKRYEETDASVRYGIGWNRRDDDFRGTGWYAWSGGAAAESMTPGAQATFTFTGTSVTWIGMRGYDSGIARVFVDGVFVSEVDMFMRSNEIHVPIFTASGLTNSSHTLTIEATGRKNGDSQAASSPLALVVVDAFDVPAPVVSQLQDTDPDLSFTTGWTPWDNSKPWSSWFATDSTTPGARARLPFIGTSISWIGYRGPDAGIASVYLDGSFAGEVDLYNPGQRVQAIVFTSPTMADANHTLTIEATGRKNANSTGTRVVVDAFLVTTLGRRFEETDPSITYTGNWDQGNFNRAWSMRTVTVSGEPGAQATFTFSGTSVSWIGSRKSTTGIARVYLDGAFVTEIDTYSPTDGLQDTIFRTSGLAAGTHTLTIEVTGRKNAASSSAYIVVDAFDARP
ncbi:MAG TPA: Ig-like domain-containing protein [Burkholderiales bacterium]|jgi:hypothetical protein|nr:Ig-like domain-containing protein [Burkholderiales bacterium]